MPDLTPDLLAKTILTKEKRKADAKAVLHRTASTGLIRALALLLPALASYLLSVEKFEAPLSVKMLLAGAFIASILNTVDLWTTRRRLDAAITLLQLEQE